MEIKVYDESGKVIRIIPMYQGGGLVLPQYTPTDTTMYTPQQSANTSLDMSQRNLEFQSQRETQQAQLGLQRDQQIMNAYQFGIDARYRQADLEIKKEDLVLRQQNQERLNKQLELQNERFKQEILQSNNLKLEEIIASDDDMFLPRDRASMDKLLEESGFSDKDVLSLDPNDSQAIYRLSLGKKALLAGQKNSLTNKRKWDESGKVIGNIADVEKRAKELLDSGYFDYNQYMDYMKSFNAVQQKRQDWANGKINDYDIETDPDYQRIQQHASFINEAEMQKVMAMEIKKQDLVNRSLDQKIRQGEVDIKEQEEKMKRDQLMAPINRTIEMAKAIGETAQGMKDVAFINSALPPDKQFDFSNPDKVQETMSKLTQEDWAAISKKLEEKVQSGQKLNLEEQLLDAVMRGDMDTYNTLLEVQRQITAAKNKEYTVNYQSDASGTYQVDKSGNKNYGGWMENEKGQPTKIVFKGREYNTDEDGLVQGIPDEARIVKGNHPATGKPTAFLQIKGSSGENRDWLIEMFPDWEDAGPLWFDAWIDKFPEFEGAPQGTYYEGGYLYIPADSVNLQPNTQPAAGGGTGSYFQGGGSAPASSGTKWTP